VAHTSDEVRATRSELDWALVNDPEAARRRTAEALASHSQEAAAETIRRGFALSYDAFSRRDWELNTLLLDPDDLVFLAADFREALPDARERYLGIAGYLEAMLLFLESWSKLEVKLEDLLELGPDRAVSLMRFKGRGRRSGLAFEQLAVGDHAFREGLCVIQTYWWDSHRAARELGLSLPSEPRAN
jgi:hypothetical protein